MGNTNSTPQDGVAEDIMRNVIILKERLQKEEEIDRSLKTRILIALNNYKSKIAQMTRNKEILAEKSFNVRKMIDEAKFVLENLKISEINLKNTVKDEIPDKRHYLLEAARAVKTQTKTDQTEHVLKNINYFAQCSEELELTPQEDKAISLLFLQLFAKMPKEDSAKLDETLKLFYGFNENFKKLEQNDRKRFCEETKHALSGLTQEREKYLKNTRPNTICVSRSNSLLVKNENDKIEATQPVEKSQVIEKEEDLKIVEEEKIDEEVKTPEPEIKDEEAKPDVEIAEENDDLPSEDSVDSVSKKPDLPVIEEEVMKIDEEEVGETQKVEVETTEIDEILEVICEEDENESDQNVLLTQQVVTTPPDDEDVLNQLKTIEAQTFTQIESLESFREKLAVLEQASKDVEQTNTEQIQKTTLLDKIKGCIVAETMSYLREVKNQISHYKSYASEFPYPNSVDIFHNKIKEISSLKDNLRNLPAEPCIQNRADILLHQVNEVLGVLKERANYNEKLARCLKKLEKITEDLGSWRYKQLSEFDKLKHYIDIRRTLSSVGDHSRLHSRKEQAIRYLNDMERSILSGKHPEKMKKIKDILDKNEEVLQDLGSLDSDKILLRKKGIMYRQESIEKLKINREEMGIIRYIFNESIRVVDENVTRRKSIENLLSEGSNNFLDDSSQLEDYKAKTEEDESVKILRYQKTINVLKEKMKQMDRINFSELLNSIFTVKENVEDISEANTQKEALLKEIFLLLSNLDQEILQFVKNSKHDTQIVQNEDKFDPQKLEIPREGVEYVKFITGKAQSFEIYIDSYFGTADAQDYNRLFDNLMFLLKELKELDCQGNNDLIRENIKATNYVERLIRRLKANAGAESK